MATTWTVEKYVNTVFSETFSVVSPINWTVWGGNSYIAILPQGPFNYLQLGDNSGDDELRIAHNNNIAYDPTKLYKMTVEVEHTQGTGTMYVGWTGVASDGVTLVNTIGANSIGSNHYHTITNHALTASWVQHIGYTQGHATVGGNGDSGVGTLLSPSKMHYSTVYVRPHILANWANQSGIMAVKSVLVEAVGAPAPVADGTILSPRGQSYSEVSASTIQQLDLADGSKGIVLPETKYNNQSMKFFWHKVDFVLKTKLEGYVNSGTGVRLTTHISGKRYTGYFINIESELMIGTKAEQYNITAEFLPFVL